MYLLMNYCVIPTLIISSIMPTFSNNIMMIWFIMEINNLMFIIYMMGSMNKKKMIFLYFIIQVMASFLLMFSLVFSALLTSMITHMTLFLCLMMKTGLPPLHLWMISMSSSMPWMVMFLMLTSQKIAPLYIFSLTKINLYLIMFIIFISMVLPSIMMLNITNFKKLLIYSSINQSGWMITLIFLKTPFWFMYMIMYISITFMITKILQISKVSNWFFQYSFKSFNLIFTIMMMNMASMPPFCFFIFKWISTFLIISNSNLMFIMITMLFNSLIMTFIYIKMMTWSLFMNKFSLKMKLIMKKTKINKITLFILILLLPMIMLI